ncbi:MAG: hypothetical protein EOO45_28525 [Flavobacterium sp.]|nr:MAG: hypothetical protein EOO45_28525 [Flavobacterium sp.]
MKKITLILLTIFFAVTFTSCRKLDGYDPSPEPVLPVVSSEGRNTFGFMFGSEVWTHNVYTTSLPILSSTYSTSVSSSTLVMVCRRKSPRYSGSIDAFYLRFAAPDFGTGNFPLNSSNSAATASVTMADKTERAYELHNAGLITFIRWDLKNRIASGTFSLELKDVHSGDIVAVTDGRFDVKFKN